MSNFSALLNLCRPSKHAEGQVGFSLGNKRHEQQNVLIISLKPHKPATFYKSPISNA
jgi:hypothetical protein